MNGLPDEALAKSGAPEGIRTPDTQLRKLVLYPLSYRRARLSIVTQVAMRPNLSSNFYPQLSVTRLSTNLKTLYTNLRYAATKASSSF